MATKHEKVCWAVIEHWTQTQRGRLFFCRQGMAVPLRGRLPIWFGPLKRNYKGFPDLFGYEYVHIYHGRDKTILPVFCLVEVKTKAHPTLSEDQKQKLQYNLGIGGKSYVAREYVNELGFRIEEYKPGEEN